MKEPKSDELKQMPEKLGPANVYWVMTYYSSMIKMIVIDISVWLINFRYKETLLGAHTLLLTCPWYGNYQITEKRIWLCVIICIKEMTSMCSGSFPSLAVDFSPRLLQSGENPKVPNCDRNMGIKSATVQSCHFLLFPLCLPDKRLRRSCFLRRRGDAYALPGVKSRLLWYIYNGMMVGNRRKTSG